MEQINIVGGHWVQVFEFGSEHSLIFTSIFKFYIDQKIANQVRSNQLLLLCILRLLRLFYNNIKIL